MSQKKQTKRDTSRKKPAKRDASQKTLSAAERKKLQRERDKSRGWVEVTVKVSHEHADKVRLYAAQLPKPRGPAKPKKRDAVETLKLALDEIKSWDKDKKAGK